MLDNNDENIYEMTYKTALTFHLGYNNKPATPNQSKIKNTFT